MGLLADISGRPEGPVFMGNMIAALERGPYRQAEDDLVLTEPGWTLFSLDFAADEAVFLDVGAETDLSAAPFSYQRQFETARRILRLPIPAFLDLADRCPVEFPLVHVFNMGHCGSTLLHHVFNRSGQAWSLSEPLFTFDLAMNRASLDPGRRVALLRAGFRMLRAFPFAQGRRIAVKHYSQMNTILADCAKAELDAFCLFLYRSGEAWCNSLFGFHQRLGGGLALDREQRLFSWQMMSGNRDPSCLESIVDMAAPVVTFETLAAAAWAYHVQDHARAVAAGVRLFSFRYDELNADRAGVLAEIFRYCCLSTEAVAVGLAAFEQDSHKGAATARDRPAAALSQSDRRRVADVFANPRLSVTGSERLEGAAL